LLALRLPIGGTALLLLPGRFAFPPLPLALAAPLDFLPLSL
jgi:hypothetical protein